MQDIGGSIWDNVSYAYTNQYHNLAQTVVTHTCSALLSMAYVDSVKWRSL